MEIALIVLFLLALYWYGAMQARERSMTVTKRACEETNMVLLDETVYLTHLALKRNDDRQLQIRRIYTFRAMDRHTHIYHGTLILLGKKVESLLLEETGH